MNPGLPAFPGAGPEGSLLGGGKAGGAFGGDTPLQGGGEAEGTPPQVWRARVLLGSHVGKEQKVGHSRRGRSVKLMSTQELE